MLVAFTSIVGFNCTTPAASFLRTPPSRPRASARSRALACGPHDVQSGHVSLLVPNLPRQVAQRRSPTRGIRAPSETPPRRRRRNNRPCGWTRSKPYQ